MRIRQCLMVLSSTMIYSREFVKGSVTKTKPGSPLLVPSAEILYLRGATNLENLIEIVDEGWIKFVPLAKGPRPQPGLAVGLKSSAFTSEQLKKLQPFIGDWKTTSRLVTTYEMYFPLLTAEVKCGNEALRCGKCCRRVASRRAQPENSYLLNFAR